MWAYLFQAIFRHGFLYRESSHIPASLVSPLIRFPKGGVWQAPRTSPTSLTHIEISSDQGWLSKDSPILGFPYSAHLAKATAPPPRNNIARTLAERRLWEGRCRHSCVFSGVLLVALGL